MKNTEQSANQSTWFFFFVWKCFQIYASTQYLYTSDMPITTKSNTHLFIFFGIDKLDSHKK